MNLRSKCITIQWFTEKINLVKVVVAMDCNLKASQHGAIQGHPTLCQSFCAVIVMPISSPTLPQRRWIWFPDFLSAIDVLVIGGHYSSIYGHISTAHVQKLLFPCFTL